MFRVLNQTVVIDWARFVVGASIFIPCLNRDEVEEHVLNQCSRFGYKTTVKQVIEKGMYGVRAWRTE